MHEMFYHETVHDTEFLNFASRQDRTLNRDINDIGPWTTVKSKKGFVIFSIFFSFDWNMGPWAGFSIDQNFKDVMTSNWKNLDVNIQNMEVMQ